MHGIRQRQLRLALFTLFFAVINCFASAAGTDAPKQQAARELQAARLMEVALRQGGGSPDDRHKMDKVYADLAKRFPDDVSIKNSQAFFLWECGEHERAEKIWKEAENLAPNNSATQYGLGTAALAAGDVKTAAHRMSKACEGDVGNAAYHFELANILFLFRHELLDPVSPAPDVVIQRALKHYAEACRLAPLNVEFARGHAETFYGLPTPDWPAALTAWQHLLEISPSKDFALANLATVHLKLGDKIKARDCAEKITSPEFSTRKVRLLKRIEKE